MPQTTTEISPTGIGQRAAAQGNALLVPVLHSDELLLADTGDLWTLTRKLRSQSSLGYWSGLNTRENKIPINPQKLSLA